MRNFAKIRDRLKQPTDLDGLDEHVAIVSAQRLTRVASKVIALYYSADLSVAEGAETLGRPVETVKSRLERGASRSQSRWAGYEYDVWIKTRSGGDAAVRISPERLSELGDGEVLTGFSSEPRAVSVGDYEERARERGWSGW